MHHLKFPICPSLGTWGYNRTWGYPSIWKSFPWYRLIFIAYPNRYVTSRPWQNQSDPTAGSLTWSEISRSTTKKCVPKSSFPRDPNEPFSEFTRSSQLYEDVSSPIPNLTKIDNSRVRIQARVRVGVPFVTPSILDQILSFKGVTADVTRVGAICPFRSVRKAKTTKIGMWYNRVIRDLNTQTYPSILVNSSPNP